MNEHDWLGQQFEENRNHLRAVAYRMLGSESEAEDAVQEGWLRLNRVDTADVENLGGWLTTVVARVCLDMLRARKARREHPLDTDLSGPMQSHAEGTDPEHQALLAASIGPALLMVLDTLTPDERLAFVLHDMFDLSFNDIAPIVGRSPAAARQLASRARRRVRGATTPPDNDQTRQREVVDAFLAASRDGDFAGLLEVLDPDIEFRADPDAVRLGGLPVIRGARAFAEHFSGTARAARTVLVNGEIGATWAPGGKPRVVLLMTIEDDRIVSIDAVANPERLGEMKLEFLDI
jgi:RNA polymerase sigma-70 factor (ECF subfamily)